MKWSEQIEKEMIKIRMKSLNMYKEKVGSLAGRGHQKLRNWSEK